MRAIHSRVNLGCGRGVGTVGHWLIRGPTDPEIDDGESRRRTNHARRRRARHWHRLRPSEGTAIRSMRVRHEDRQPWRTFAAQRSFVRSALLIVLGQALAFSDGYCWQNGGTESSRTGLQQLELSDDQRILIGPEENPQTLRLAVRKLLAAGNDDFLREQLLKSTKSGLPQIILEEFGASAEVSTEQRLGIVHEILPTLSDHESPLYESAWNYVDAFARVERSAVVDSLRSILIDQDAATASRLGAVQAAAALCDWDLVIPLTTAGSQDPRLVPDVEQALRKITYQDLVGMEAWQTWATTQMPIRRELALEQVLENVLQSKNELELENVALWRRMLEKGKVGDCALALEKRNPAVRRLAIKRLTTLIESGTTPPAVGEDFNAVRLVLESRLRGEDEAVVADDDELASLALLYGRLAAGDVHARGLLLESFQTASPGLQGQLTGALLAVVQNKPDPVVSAEFRAALSSMPPQEVQEQLLEAIGKIGEEPELQAILPRCQQTSSVPPLRVRAIQAVVGIAERLPDSEAQGTVFNVLIECLQADPSDVVRSTSGDQLQRLIPKLSPDHHADAFVALKDAIDADLSNAPVVEALSGSLCRIPGQQAKAVAAIAGWLKSIPEDSKSSLPDTLLNRLKTIVDDDVTEQDALLLAIEPLVNYLPYGGVNVVPERRGFSASMGIKKIIARQEVRGDEATVDVRERVAKACRDTGRFAWAADHLNVAISDFPDLLEQRNVRAQLTWQRAEDLRMVQLNEQQRYDDKIRVSKATERWQLLTNLLNSPNLSADLPEAVSKQIVLEGVLAAAQDLEDTEIAAQTLTYGQELLSMVEQSRRPELVQQICRFALRAGDRDLSRQLLNAEFGATVEDLEVLLLKAQSLPPVAEQVDGEGLEIYRALIGVQGQGGKIGSDHPMFRQLAIELATLYLQLDQTEKALQTFERIEISETPTEAERQLRERMEQVGSNSESGESSPPDQSSHGGAP